MMQLKNGNLLMYCYQEIWMIADASGPKSWPLPYYMTDMLHVSSTLDLDRMMILQFEDTAFAQMATFSFLNRAYKTSDDSIVLEEFFR